MSMMDWTGVDFTGLANLNIGDLRDSQLVVSQWTQVMIPH
jgi:hypothetical protein